MAAGNRRNESLLKQSRRQKKSSTIASTDGMIPETMPNSQASKANHPVNNDNNSHTATSKAEDHLPPILLSLVVFTCSSIVFILCLRDFCMTGKNIFGVHDDMHMVRIAPFVNTTTEIRCVVACNGQILDNSSIS
jgi:hypothetical protein